MTPGRAFEPGPHWCEASALSNVSHKGGGGMGAGGGGGGEGGIGRRFDSNCLPVVVTFYHFSGVLLEFSYFFDHPQT